MRRFRYFTDGEVMTLIDALNPTPPSETSRKVFDELVAEHQLRLRFAECEANGGHDRQIVAAGGPHGATVMECSTCGYGKLDDREFSLLFPSYGLSDA